MKSGGLELQALYECAQQYSGEYPANGGDPGSNEYASIVRTILQQVSDEGGVYVWGYFDSNGRWKTVYVGKTDSSSNAGLRTRLSEELCTEKIFIWRESYASDEQLVEYALNAYAKPGPKSAAHYRRALKKQGVSHILWVETPVGIVPEKVESWFVELMNPTANQRRLVPSACHLDTALATLHALSRQIAAMRPETPIAGNELTDELGLMPLQRFQGCLLAGAVGDALGAAVEFMSWADIQRKFGPQGVCDFTPAYGRSGAITDDTQMTLFTAEGLLRAYVRAQSRGMCNPGGVMVNAYLRWLHTQSEAGKGGDPTVSADGWLVSLRALHNRRAPGNTCIQALQAYQRERNLRAVNNSKGCGGVMRAAPVGMFHWSLNGVKHLNETFDKASEFAAITHGHPTGYLTAGVLAVVVQLLLDGQPLTAAIAAAKTELCKHSFHEETLTAIERVEQLASDQVAPQDAIYQLGEGWVAEEALAISLYCALKATGMREALLMAVNHSGDSDSTGAITGNLVGAQMGVASIPPAWLETLELVGEIAEVAEDLLQCPGWKLGEFEVPDEVSKIAMKKYPGC